MGDGDEQSKELRGSSSSSSSSSSSENAGERMKVASVEALSELVWSPRNGLTLRCADFSFARKPQLLSPNFFHHIGQQTNNNNTEKTMSTQQEEEEEDAVGEGNQACNEMNRSLSGVGDSVEDMKPEREAEMDENKVETNDDSETRVESSKRFLGIEEPEALLANEQLGSQEEEETNLDAERLEATDENDLAGKALVACESRGDEAGSSGSHERLAKAKGKEKALSDGNFEGRNNDDDDDDESFGSVESCNSAGLLSRGKKRPPGFEQQLILGSKRLKTLSQECLGSTSKLKQDSSFMNWISNMTKGIWKGNEEEDNSPFIALTTTTSDANAQQELSPKENRNTGFQSFFQSIYCPKIRGQEMDSSNVASVQEALPWVPEQCLITKGDHLSSSGEDKDPNISPSKSKPSEEQKTCNEDVEKVAPSSTNKSSSLQSKPKPSEEQKTCGEAVEKVTPSLTNKNSGPESLWISRFSSKRYGSQVAKEDANAILPIVSSLRIESSEAMASLFARRLEAMKHIMPSGENEGQTTVVICFYCGKKGHRLQDCLQVTDTELRDLVQNISARNGKEEASSLCIRCFQLSHWAATCPNAPLYSPRAEDRAMKHALASTPGTKLPFTDVPKAVFDAVQILRLTRTDVLKWINTKKSVWRLEGFFLRLRLGKWEEGLGGTGYHVARIEGATEEQSLRKHSVSSSIPVKVGGMTCYVESQFISNKDFLEDELKAWWRSTRKSGERSGGDSFPSAEELSRKIQQRKMLGV